MTWLRAAPFLAVILLGAARFAAGVLVVCTGPDPGPGHRASARDVVGTAVYGTGFVLALVGVWAAIGAESCYECNLTRFGMDD